MSQDVNTNPFGFQSDSDESLQVSGSARKFGLNQGVTITSVEYKPTDMQGNPSPALNFEFADNQGGKFFMTLYGNIKLYDSNRQERTDKTSKDYIEKYNKEISQVNAVITHFATKGIPEEEYKAKYNAAGINSVEKMLTFGAAAINVLVSKKIPLDMFLQYQWSIKGDKTKTFLEVPQNMKSGIFLAPDTTGTEWKEVRDKDGLKYISGDKQHPFTRNASFMASNNAKEQTKNSAGDLSEAANAMNAAGSGTASNNWV